MAEEVEPAGVRTEAERTPIGNGKPKTKADFVRRHRDLSAKELIEKGKAEGVKLSTMYVYEVRAYDLAPRVRPPRKRRSKRASLKLVSPAAPKVEGIPKAPKPKSKLSNFIMSCPKAMPVAEVIARAKAAGMVTSRSNVSRVRGMARTSPKTSKADFVRKYPDLTAPMIVEKGAAAGLIFEADYVHTVRGYDRRTGSKNIDRPTTLAPHVSAPPAPSATTTPAAASDEDVLRAIVTVIGLRRAFETLDGERARVRGVLGR
jgi:hypothetical protein